MRYDVSGHICPYQRRCDYNQVNNVIENKSHEIKLKCGGTFCACVQIQLTV